ncbi:hypothetical protein B0H13DRAFT_1983058 [Mycena leptocephala]|nr:hypothetical protein B0H13DRAFT_1983058 [Mycena leptocephala]
MYLFSKLFTFSLCALSTLDAPGRKNALTSQDGISASVMDNPLVTVVNVQYNGAAFAYPGGRVLVTEGNTTQGPRGVWEQIPFKDDLYRFKHRMSGLYIRAMSDGSLMVLPQESPTVFQVTAAGTDTYKIKVAGSDSMLWDVEGGSMVVKFDDGSDHQLWTLVAQPQ